MIQRWFKEPRRDAELAGALRRVDAAAPRSSVSDEALQARIAGAARPRWPVSAAQPRVWWEWMVVWARIAVPLGLAASVAAAAVLTWKPRSAVLSAVAADTAAELSVADTLLATASDEWLLTQAIRSPAGW